MSQLTLEIPDKLLESFKIAAQRRNTQVEQLIIEQLALISRSVEEPTSLAGSVEQLFRQSGLLVRTEPLEKQSECERFLQKHIASTQTLSGPRTEEGRWIVGTMRRYTNAVKMLQVKLKDGGKGVGIAEFVSLALGKTFEILVNEEIFPTYSFSSNFARFMTEYLQGKPIWLA